MVKLRKWSVAEHIGFSSCDTIASAVKVASDANFDVVAVTDDVRIASLVQPGIEVFDCHLLTQLDVKWCFEQFGAGPSRILDILALGPVSPGHGAQLLSQYGSMEALLKAPKGMPAGLATAIRGARGEINLLRQLYALHDYLFAGRGLPMSAMKV